MNPALITRAVQRHRSMQDAPAYREFLEYVRSRHDTLLVPQSSIAKWWERRQVSALEWRHREGVLVVDCDLPGACVEIDGDRVEALPAKIEFGPGAAGGAHWPVHDERLDTPFFRELVSHLGYGHVRPAGGGTPSPALTGESLADTVQALLESARQHQRYGEVELAALRRAFADAHRAAGLPDLRLWTLPSMGGKPARAAVSSRYDVDKAIVNLPAIHDLEESFDLRSTVYLRPLGMFYGGREIRRYLQRVEDHEIALHGEFISTAEDRFGDEYAAAREEKRTLEELCGREVHGVCMHGGELRTNTSPRTRDAIERAGYRYETMYRNRYYLPLHLPDGDGVRRTLSIGQHYADISAVGAEDFVATLRDRFVERYEEARAVGGVFVPVMHPLYFDLGHYLRQPMSQLRIAAFLPRFLVRVARTRSGQHYSNEAP